MAAGKRLFRMRTTRSSSTAARIRLTHEKTIEALPLAELGVDLVIDCTGVFKTAAKVAPYFAAGVKKVVVSAPVKDGGALNLVYGVNHHLYDPGTHHLITAASCTTNCLAPVVKVIHEGHRHPARLDHHDPRRDQYPDHRRPPRQGHAPRTVGAAEPDPDHDRLGHGDHADLSRNSRAG